MGTRNARPRRSASFGIADAQLAAPPASRARRDGVARRGEAHDAREAAEAALDQVKAGVAARRAARAFSPTIEQRVALDDDADGGRVDAREIDGDLDGVVGLEDVERRRAFAGERRRADGAAELEEGLPDLVGEVARPRTWRTTAWMRERIC